MKIFNTKFIAGIIIVLLGVLTLLNNFGYTDISLGSIIRTYWPVILLIWAASLFKDLFAGFNQGRNENVSTSWGQLISSLVIFVIGIIFLGRNLELFEADLSLFWRMFWPVIIILFGISFMRGKTNSESGKGHWAFMGGIEVGKTPFDLKSGNYYALMGGIDIDLTKANMPKGKTMLDLTAVMGGIDIIVPKDINIVCEGTALLGGIEFLKESTGGIISTKKMENIVNDDNRVIHFQTRALMGGVSIKQSNG